MKVPGKTDFKKGVLLQMALYVIQHIKIRIHASPVQVNNNISNITSIPNTKETSEYTIIKDPLALNRLLYSSARSKSENRSSVSILQNYQKCLLLTTMLLLLAWCKWLG